MASEGLRGGNKQGGRVAVTVCFDWCCVHLEKMEVVELLWQSIVLGRRRVE